MTEPVRLMSTSYTVTLGSKRKPKCNGTTPALAKGYTLNEIVNFTGRDGKNVPHRVVICEEPDRVFVVPIGEEAHGEG